MEAAICRKKAVALSYAFFSRDHDPVATANASKISVKLIEYLLQNWHQDVDLYSINVPLKGDLEQTPRITYTSMLQNYWNPVSSFQEVEVDEEDDDPAEHEQHIRQEESRVESGSSNVPETRHTHKHFRWAPRFSDVHDSVKHSTPGHDGWAVAAGFIR